MMESAGKGHAGKKFGLLSGLCARLMNFLGSPKPSGLTNFTAHGQQVLALNEDQK